MTDNPHLPTNSQIFELKKLKSSEEESGISPRISRITSIFFLAKFAKSQRKILCFGNFFCVLCVFARDYSVQIRVIRGAEYKQPTFVLFDVKQHSFEVFAFGVKYTLRVIESCFESFYDSDLSAR